MKNNMTFKLNTKTAIKKLQKWGSEYIGIGIDLQFSNEYKICERYKAETGANKTFVIEKALEKYLDEAAPIDK